MSEKTFFSLVTGNSVSAIATFILFGNKYLEILKKIFISKGSQKQSLGDFINYGLIKVNDIVYDEVIVKNHQNATLFPYFPHCEINIHGSIGIINALRELFKSMDLYELNKMGLIQYALKNGYINYIDKELYHELYHTQSQKYTSLLLEEKKKPFLNYIKSNIDNTVFLTEFLQSLLDKYIILKRFKKPIKVGIFGAVNAGKSTLFNCLTNTQRAITSSLAATTRDYISHIVCFKEYSIKFLDTAGIWKSNDFINLKAKEVTKKLWNTKNILKVIVFSYDAPIPREFIKTLEQQNSILVYNKIDIEKFGTPSKLNQEKIIQISALKNINIAMVHEEIEKKIKLDEFLNLTNPIIFTRRQQILIQKMLNLLNNNEKSKLKLVIEEIEKGKE